MLSNAAVTHSDKDCSLKKGGNIVPVVYGLKKRDDISQERGITFYWMVTGVHEHVSQAFPEDHIDKVTQFMWEAFVTHSAFKITPLQ